MNTRTMIIAEAGVNHNGDMNLAKRLIDVAVEAKVDYIKFQTFKADKLVTKKAQKAAYQIKNTEDNDGSQYDMLKKLELSHENHIELIKYCKEKDIKFFSTAFDSEGVDYLYSLDLDFFKIPSGEITNYPYLKKIALTRKPVILSTGMCSEKEIEDAIGVLIKFGNERKNITILHCNTEYPTPMKDVNLRAMLTIRSKFDVEVGYSDHTLGIEIPIAAVALGATVIEKHFTLDRNLPGPDHKASLEPDELKEMVRCIRNIEKAMGNGIKEPSESEKKNIIIARKSIHLTRNIPKGTILVEEDLISLRPGDGISPMEWENVIGKMLVEDMAAFDKLNWDNLI